MYKKEDYALFRLWRCRDHRNREALDHMNDTEAADAFGELPSFGTGGIRKLMGIGANRVNTVTIRWAAAALAKSLKVTDPSKKVLIGFDTRKNSAFYAKETALTLNSFGIGTVLFEEPIPVPLLSYTLKHEDYLCGVMITASHNPKEYNGFKVYNANGGQITPEEAKEIEQYFLTVDPFAVNPCSEKEATEQKLMFHSGKAEEAAYLTAITKTRIIPSEITLIATPLHGGGWKLLPAALKRCGHTVIVPKEQKDPKEDFPTITSPNPEDPKVFQLARIYGKHHNADILLATDGDGDRCGCCVLHNGEYLPLCGNDIAAILLYYLIKREKNRIPENSYVVCTEVSGVLGAKIAQTAKIEVRTVPTGFKYIGAMISAGNGSFFAGYEESGGFLFGDHAADKDGISTAVLLSEAAAYYKKQGKTLFDVLKEIHRIYGREYTSTHRFAFPGKDGATRKDACIRHFKETEFPPLKKEIRKDTILFSAEKGIKIALRPSGTEPELKMYRIFSAEEEATAERTNHWIDELFFPVIEGFCPVK